MVSVGRRRHVGHKIHEKFESEEFVGERQQIGSVGSGGRGRHGWSHRTRTCCRGRSQGRCARHQNHCARDGAWSSKPPWCRLAGTRSSSFPRFRFLVSPRWILVKLPTRILASVRKTREVLDSVDADVIVGFGGYVALPAYLAARGGVLRRRRKIPIVIHEANASAGIANKIGARLATRVLAAVPGSGVKNRGDQDAEIVGIPVRASIANFDRAGLRSQAREYFGLPQDGPVLLVFGGSQGAKSLNDAVSGAAEELAKAGISVLHAHGPKNSLEVTQYSETAPYVAVPYLSRMDLAYAAADATICRSGAMTVAEVSAVGLRPSTFRCRTAMVSRNSTRNPLS